MKWISFGYRCKHGRKREMMCWNWQIAHFKKKNCVIVSPTERETRPWGSQFYLFSKNSLASEGLMWERVLLVTGGFSTLPNTWGTDQTRCSKHKAKMVNLKEIAKLCLPHLCGLRLNWFKWKILADQLSQLLCYGEQLLLMPREILTWDANRQSVIQGRVQTQGAETGKHSGKWYFMFLNGHLS